MVNVLVPIINNAKGFDKILTSISSYSQVNILIGVVASQKQNLQLSESENIHIIEFQEGSKREEIINSLQKYIVQGSILIMRKPISENEFNNFVNNPKNIVTCKRNLSNFKKSLLKIWQKILKIFLGVRLYKGDTSVVYFDEDISSVVLSSTNLSYNSRVDRWKGIEQGTVKVEGDLVKTDIDKNVNIRNIIIAIIALAIAVTVTTVVCLFARVNLIVGLLLFCLDFISLAIAFVLTIITIFNCLVGKRQFGFAVEKDDKLSSKQDQAVFEKEEDDE